MTIEPCPCKLRGRQPRCRTCRATCAEAAALDCVGARRPWPEPPARPLNFERLDAALLDLIQAREGDPAVEAFVRHPDGFFGREFNRAAAAADGDGAGRVYVNSTRALSRQVSAGAVSDLDHFRRLAVLVLRTYGTHHGRLAWHRDHPLARPDGAASGPKYLFVGGLDLTGLAAPSADPAGNSLYAVPLAAVRAAAREIGRLHRKVYHAYRRYEHETGTTYGAYVHIARGAVLDPTGRVVGVGSWRAPRDRAIQPAPGVVRQVRVIHAESRALVHAAARRLGYRPPAL